MGTRPFQRTGFFFAESYLSGIRLLFGMGGWELSGLEKSWGWGGLRGGGFARLNRTGVLDT